MSEPAAFLLIRGGKRRYYADRWANVFLYRELLWGPEEFETWAASHEELEEFDDDCDGGVTADFDRKRLLWSAEADVFRIPRVKQAYDRLLQTAWPGFEVEWMSRLTSDLPEGNAIAAQESDNDDRTETVKEAGLVYDDEDADSQTFDDDDIRAWVTLIDSSGSTRHRHLAQLPKDLLRAHPECVAELSKLPPAEVPPEAVVAEGMWIDQARRMIGLWGDQRLHRLLPRIQQSWPEWSVVWAEHGYVQQCEVSGPAGVPLSQEEALAKFMPVVLSTKRFDISSMLTAFGGGVRRFAIKATGCLFLVLCLPLVLFGLVSGDWTSVLITGGIMLVVTIVAFKILEYRFRKMMTPSVPESIPESPQVAGPLDGEERRRRIDALLAAAGMPPLRQIEPYFSKDPLLEMID